MFEAPVVSVHIPLALRPYAGGHDEVTASGETVGEVLEAVVHEYPAIRSQLLAGDGGLRPGVALFLGPCAIRESGGLSTPIAQEEVWHIVQAGTA